MKKYIIIGGVAGGASAAARLRRLDEHAEIILFEKGEYISYANCGLPYYIGNVIKDRNKLLVQTATSFSQRFNIDVRTLTEVIDIDIQNKLVHVRKVDTQQQYSESFDKLILSPGADPVRPPLPGIESKGIFTLRTVNDTDRIKQYVSTIRKGHAVVVGGGFIGLEMAENLYELGFEVTIVEMGNQVMAPIDFEMAALVQEHIRKKGVNLLLHTAVESFKEHSDGSIAIQLNNGEELEAQIVILSIGVRADTRLAVNAGLKLGMAKGIWVNEYLQTSHPDIYAVGDAIEFPNPITGNSMNTFLAGPANKQGRICANNIVRGNTEKYKGSINTAIVKVFDLTVATAGVAAKHLRTYNIPYIVSTTHSGSHAGYYPGSKQMSIQLAFNESTGVILGAQIVGYDGVDKRIDTLASIIQRGSTVEELTEFEHAYAPPYSSAKDPVNMAGFVAQNIMTDMVRMAYGQDIEIKNYDILVDVRTISEYRKGAIEGAINIPVDDLRNRLSELPMDKNILIYCEAGLRGYLAQRILRQNGYAQVRNLSGGYYLWNVVNNEKSYKKKVM